MSVMSQMNKRSCSFHCCMYPIANERIFIFFFFFCSQSISNVIHMWIIKLIVWIWHNQSFSTQSSFFLVFILFKTTYSAINQQSFEMKTKFTCSIVLLKKSSSYPFNTASGVYGRHTRRCMSQLGISLSPGVHLYRWWNWISKSELTLIRLRVLHISFSHHRKW